MHSSVSSNKILDCDPNRKAILKLPHILIVEDEIKLRSHLAQILKDGHFSVSTCETYPGLVKIIESAHEKFDVIVLDRLLNGLDSAQLIEKIKHDLPEIKIIVLSAIATPAEKAVLLNLGADDYLAKPFDEDELIARINVVLRRINKNIHFSNLFIDIEARSIRVGDQEISLTNKEFYLLKTLLQTPGKVFAKPLLYEKVWGMSSDVESNVIETTANKLRQRLKGLGANFQIKNLRNVGYWVEK